MDFQSFPYQLCDLVLLFNLCVRSFVHKIKNWDNNSIYLIWDISGLSDMIHVKCSEHLLAQRKSSVNVNIDV